MPIGNIVVYIWSAARNLVVHNTGIGISFFSFNNVFTMIIGYKIIIVLEPQVQGKLRGGWHCKEHDIYGRNIADFGAGHRFIVVSASKTSINIV